MKDDVPTRDSFDRLLEWLDGNRDCAGTRYEEIRGRLIKIFACRGCFEAEDLADETINRVTSKLPEIQAIYTGKPALYFYSVAHRVHLEYLRNTQQLLGSADQERTSAKPPSDTASDMTVPHDDPDSTAQKPTTRPPFNAEYVLHLLLLREERDCVAGDLVESYDQMLQRFDKRRADIWFYKEVAGSLWPLLRRALLKLGALVWLGRVLRRLIS